jgi:hypothetical protein
MLPPVHSPKFWDSGGEAVIWTAVLNGKKVIVRNAHPPEGKDWTSPSGKDVLKVHISLTDIEWCEITDSLICA